jgi:hypothetical protein
MKKILSAGLWVCFFTASVPLGAQWARTYAYSGLAYSPKAVSNSIRPTYDGGFIVAGGYYTNDHAYEALVMKLSPDGTIEWQLSWGDQYQDWASSAVQTKDGGYIIGGLSYEGGRILKLTADGSVEWSKILGLFLDVNAIVQTPDGGYILGGSRASIVKLSAAGDIEWQFKFSGNESGWKNLLIQPTLDGGYIVGGNDIMSGVDIYVTKLGARGEIQWRNYYPAPWKAEGVGYMGRSPADIRQTKDGGYIVIGFVPGQKGTGGRDIWILKLFATGDIEWQKTFGGKGEDQGFSIIQTEDDGFIAACEMEDDYGNYDFGFLKLTANGDLISAQTFKGSGPAGVIDWGTTIEQTPDGGFITACSYRSQSGDDVLVLKLLSDGTMGPDCELVKRGSLPVTETSVIPTKGSVLREDLGLFISPSSLALQTAPLKAKLLCGTGQPLNQKWKKGVIRR